MTRSIFPPDLTHWKAGMWSIPRRWPVRRGGDPATAPRWSSIPGIRDPDPDRYRQTGHYLLQTSGAQWTDYRVNVLLSSAATNSFGLMFRVRDDNNYYRFSMDRASSFRRLVKRVNGVFTTIWQDSTQYMQNQPYRLEVTAQGTTITISLDGVQLYSGNDNSHLRGSIGRSVGQSAAHRSTTSRSRT